LTSFVLDRLGIGADDDVVELAPGLGVTATRILSMAPASYTGIERDPTGAAAVRALLRDDRDRCIDATAQSSGLADASADVLLGEAFLTMQNAANKQRIVAEAFRILRPGGRYGLHEMCLRPDDLDTTSQDRVCGELARAIRVGARPLTVADWRSMLESAGFIIDHQRTTDMALLQPKRLIADEGLGRTLRIVFNVLHHPDARRHVRSMRATMRSNRELLGAVALVATKPATSDPEPNVA
jgi:SAM-dependent methyltransferase